MYPYACVYLRRLLIAIGTVWVISVVSFVIIELPPGDYVTSYIAQLMSTGSLVTQEEAENLRAQYGLDQPVYVQYAKWMWLVLQGNFGVSMEWKRPVTEVIGDRLLLTALLAFTAVIFTWILAIPIGIYSAVRQYSVGDYVVTCMGFIGLAVPNFLLALVIMYLAFAYFGASVGGLFSTEYLDAPWSWARVLDLLKHLWIPAIILSTAGTAQLIRILRANLLDELPQTLCGDGTRQGPFRVTGDPEVSGACGAQSVHQHGGLYAALPGLGQHHRLHCVELADRWSLTPEGPARPGYVPRWHHCAAAGW